MILLGMFFIGLMALSVWRMLRKRIWNDRWLLWMLVWSVPLPVAACEFGWVAAEVGRQPWIVYGLLRTADARSPTVTAKEILFSLILFGAVYLTLGALWFWLMFKKATSDPYQ
jgi:cytochrome d ubiquinol oxidase subunit I